MVSEFMMSESDTEVIEPDPISDFTNQKLETQFRILAYAIFLGLFCELLPFDDPVFSVVLGLPFTIMSLTWCLNDAGQRDRHIGKMMRVSLILFWYVAFPIYIFQTRGFLNGIKTLLLTALFAAGVIACMALIMQFTCSNEDEFAAISDSEISIVITNTRPSTHHTLSYLNSFVYSGE